MTITSATDRRPERMVYLVSSYPGVSQTFILREVRALRALGMEIQTVSIRAAPQEELLSPEDWEEFGTTHTILPARLRDVVQVPLVKRVATTHLHAFRRRPRAYLRTLADAVGMNVGGTKSTLWQFFYFLEAILVWRYCVDRGIRHIHVHFANNGADVALLAARFAGRGVDGADALTWSFTMHGPLEFYDVARNRLAVKVAGASLVVCISDFARSQLMTFAPEEHWDKMEVVHCGVDVSKFGQPSPDGAPGAPLRVLSVTRLSPRKGQAVLVNAVGELVRRGVDVHATIVGDGPDRPGLQRLAERLGVKDRVRFAGAVGQDRIPGFYADADAFCLPSFAEGVPMVLMEAMAMRLPVVATRIMGIPELVEDGSTGLLASAGRADQLADALGALAAQPAERREMGEAGRRKVLEEFDLAQTSRKLRDTFRRRLPGRLGQPRG